MTQPFPAGPSTARVTTRCRSCEGSLAEVLSLGDLPLGNAFRSASEIGLPQERYPLVLALCADCGLSQLAHELDVPALHSQLPYYTSTSEVLLAHQRKEVDDVRSRVGPLEKSLVIEIGGSDGDLLIAFQQRGARVLGIEPVRESAVTAERRHGLEMIVDFFTERLARDLVRTHGRAKVIIANYVLPLVPDPKDFLAGLAALLADDGVALLESAYLVHMVDGVRFDGIAHVRQTWMDVSILSRMLDGHGLALIDVELLRDFRGGTIRAWVGVKGHREPAERVGMAVSAERQRSVGTPEFFVPFARKVENVVNRLPEFLTQLRASGANVAAYGGGIKASTVLNACGLTEDHIVFTVDANPLKQGMLMPGPDIPIRSPQALLDETPEYIVLLALDHVNEVAQQQIEYTSRGGRFVVPVPEPHVI